MAVWSPSRGSSGAYPFSHPNHRGPSESQHVFAPCNVIIRPTTRVDLIPDSPFTSDPNIDVNFRAPLVKKLIVPQQTTLKEILDYIKLGNSESAPIRFLVPGVAVSLYKPGKVQLSAKVVQIETERFHQKSSFANLCLASKSSSANLSSSPSPIKSKSPTLRITRRPSLAGTQSAMKPSLLEVKPTLVSPNGATSPRKGSPLARAVPDPSPAGSPQKPFSVALRNISKATLSLEPPSRAGIKFHLDSEAVARFTKRLALSNRIFKATELAGPLITFLSGFPKILIFDRAIFGKMQ